MAIKWSWAFGPETAVTLETMGWDFHDPTLAAPASTITYTYSGSPTRYSMRQDDVSYGQYFRIPTGCSAAEGWIAAPVYVSGSYISSRDLITVTGGSSGRYIKIQMKTAGTDTFALFVGNSEKTTFTMTSNDWHYVALRYSMTGSTWNARVYVDGVAATTNQTDSEAAETATSVNFGGVGSGDKITYWGQIITYDAWTDAGSTARYCTRIEPTVDTATVGTWTPNVGTHDFAVLSGSFDAATFTVNSASAIGHNCRVQAQNLATQLGVTPTSIDGITVHAWATGSGQNGFAAISDNNSNYDNGTAITPDTNDPTYAFSTAPDKPSDAAGWSATSSVYFKYEVS